LLRVTKTHSGDYPPRFVLVAAIAGRKVASASKPRRRSVGGWLRFCGQVFKSIFVSRIRVLSRRDYRTQPGVLTPGTDKKGTRPEGGGREEFSALGAEQGPQRISAAPFLLRPLFPELWRTSREDRYCQYVLGLKPQAQSCSPFGTKNSTQPNIRPLFRHQINTPRGPNSRTRTTTRTRTKRPSRGRCETG
jgi:hypothetical protein